MARTRTARAERRPWAGWLCAAALGLVAPGAAAFPPVFVGAGGTVGGAELTLGHRPGQARNTVTGGARAWAALEVVAGIGVGVGYHHTAATHALWRDKGALRLAVALHSVGGMARIVPGGGFAFDMWGGYAFGRLGDRPGGGAGERVGGVQLGAQTLYRIRLGGAFGGWAELGPTVSYTALDRRGASLVDPTTHVTVGLLLQLVFEIAP